MEASRPLSPVPENAVPAEPQNNAGPAPGDQNDVAPREQQRADAQSARLERQPSRFPNWQAISEWSEVDEAIMDHYEASRMCPHVEREARDYLAYLEMLLNTDEAGVKQMYHGSEVALSIVGSVGSGIATKFSDVDVCFRFKASPTAAPTEIKQLNLRVLCAIADVVSAIEGVHVQKILNTRCPILRFTITRPKDVRFTVEISYYSLTSLYSSSLIKAYCQWEPILPALILWTKKWAKTCDISNAMRKGLPKYGYTIMLIHYLQQCAPRRVLPRLQHEFEMYDDSMDKKTPGYFHRSIRPQWYKPNGNTAGRLWLGFLRYFTKFPFGSQMISMRTKHTTPNSRFMRGQFMTIENPFNRGHNIAKSISWPTFKRILDSFRQSRKVFSSLAVRNALVRTVSNEDFSLNLGTALLSACPVNEIPAQRQCHLCRGMGHYIQECHLIERWADTPDVRVVYRTKDEVNVVMLRRPCEITNRQLRVQIVYLPAAPELINAQQNAEEGG